MSAPLSKKLFHGTTENMKPGDVIKPTPQIVSGRTEAYATEDSSEAANYAGARARSRLALFGSVYEVEPLENDKTRTKKESIITDKETVHASDLGFRVKRHVGWVEPHK